MSIGRLFCITKMIEKNDIDKIEKFITNKIEDYGLGKRRTIENYFEKTNIKNYIYDLDIKNIFYNHYFSLKN